MATFIPRTTAPDENNAYFYADNPFYQSGYGLPNCTCYAFGRFWELTGGSMPSLSLGDAENWWSYADGYDRGQTPKLGAIVCWQKGVVGDDSDGAGHVAIVEAINEDGSILTSESGWGASNTFWTNTRANDGNWGSGSDYTFQGFIYNPINFSDSGDNTDTHPYSRTIWDYLLAKIGNKFGVAGLMGNLEAESGLYPDRVQGDIPYSDYSQNYTAQVDDGTISEYDFVNNGPNGGGYGLAQWTFSTRKQGLYDMWQDGGYSSIGSITLALDYLWHELQYSYSGVLSVLKTATSVREASDVVLHDFENPADQSETVEIERAEMGKAWYDLYAGGSINPDEPGGTIAHPKSKKLPLWLLLTAAKRRY